MNDKIKQRIEKEAEEKYKMKDKVLELSFRVCHITAATNEVKMTKEVIDALKAAKELIRKWHGVSVPKIMRLRIWDQYDSTSEEMKVINDLIIRYDQIDE